MTSSETAPAIAISATFTAEPVEESLRFWLDELGWRDAIRFAPFNQVFQQLLDPASLLAANHSGVNLLLVRLEDWGTLRRPRSCQRQRVFSGAIRSGWRIRLE